MELKKKALFNAFGDIEIRKRRMINGNTTNLNDFNNMKYSWVSDWYRQAKAFFFNSMISSYALHDSHSSTSSDWLRT